MQATIYADREWKEKPLTNMLEISLPMTNKEISDMWTFIGLGWCFTEPWDSERPQTDENIYAEMRIQNMYYIEFPDDYIYKDALQKLANVLTFPALNEVARILEQDRELVFNNLTPEFTFDIERG